MGDTRTSAFVSELEKVWTETSAQRKEDEELVASLARRLFEHHHDPLI